MSEILKTFKDNMIRHRPTWWLILDCGHWYHWTGIDAPGTKTLDCPNCKPAITVTHGMP